MRSFLLVLATLGILGCWGAPAEGRFPCSAATVASDCPAGWFCRAERCYSTRDGVPDAGIDGSVPDGGTRDGGISDAGGDAGPMARCGDGLVDEASVNALNGPLGGLETIPLPALRLEPTNTPVLGGAPIYPMITLALGSTDYGVVATVGDGEARAPMLARFDVANWRGGAAAVPLGMTYPLASLAVGRGPTGPEIVALGLRPEADVGDAAGFGILWNGTGGGPSQGAIFASDPPHTSHAAAATLGGARILDAVNEPTWLIARDELATGVPILGAVRATDGFNQYRTTTTPILADDLHLSGSASEVLLLQDPTNFTIHVWDVGATPDYTEGDPLNDYTSDLPGVDFPSGLVSIEASSTSDVHILAVPRTTGASGDVLLMPIMCDGTCTAMDPASRVVDLPAFVQAEQVELERTANGYVLAILDVQTSAIYLRFLSVDLEEIETGLPDPFLELGEVFPAARVSLAVTGGDQANTMMVAVLSRAGTSRDVVTLAGYRTCLME